MYNSLIIEVSYLAGTEKKLGCQFGLMVMALYMQQSYST